MYRTPNLPKKRRHFGITIIMGMILYVILGSDFWAFWTYFVNLISKRICNIIFENNIFATDYDTLFHGFMFFMKLPSVTLRIYALGLTLTDLKDYLLSFFMILKVSDIILDWRRFLVGSFCTDFFKRRASYHLEISTHSRF